MSSKGSMHRVGVFYDGNFFYHVSNFFLHQSHFKSRIQLRAFHDFLLKKVAKEEGVDPRRCRIVDAHLFRGRVSVAEAEVRNMTAKERAFDDVLMRENITPHYLPLTGSGEKGIDVWLALEAFENAASGRYDTVVLVATDGDFVPLVRKLHSLGVRVVLVYAEFSVIAEDGQVISVTKCSHALIDEADIAIDLVVQASGKDVDFATVFQGVSRVVEVDPTQSAVDYGVQNHHNREMATVPAPGREGVYRTPAADPAAELVEGVISRMLVAKGYGFAVATIQGVRESVFLHAHYCVPGTTFEDLLEGDLVAFQVVNSQDRIQARNVQLVKKADRRSGVGMISKLHEGAGFITYFDEIEKTTKEVFFPASQVLGFAFDELAEGDSVKFVFGENERGPMALQVLFQNDVANA